MQVNFNVFWKKSLGTLYKDNSIDTVGKEANVDIDLKQVNNIYVNFRAGDKGFTDIVEIVDIEANLIKIPFKAYVIKAGVNELELVAYMKNGSVMPSQTYAYTVDKSLENPKSIEDENNYPILIKLLGDVEGKINATDEAINRLDSSVEEMKNNITNSLKENTNAIDSHIEESLEVIGENFNTYVKDTDKDLANKFENYSNKTTSNINTVLENKSNEVDEIVNTKITEVDTKVNAKIQEVNTTVNTKITEVDTLIDSVEVSENIRQEEHEARQEFLDSFESKLNTAVDGVFNIKNDVATIKETDKRQNVFLQGLYNENLDGRVTIKEEGTVISLTNSDDGLVDIIGLEGNTLVNYCTNGSEELTLNNEINVQGTDVTLTDTVEGGKVDVILEGNTLILDEEGNEVEAGTEGARLVSVGELEDNKVEIVTQTAPFRFGKGGRI